MKKVSINLKPSTSTSTSSTTTSTSSTSSTTTLTTTPSTLPPKSRKRKLSHSVFHPQPNNPSSSPHPPPSSSSSSSHNPSDDSLIIPLQGSSWHAGNKQPSPPPTPSSPPATTPSTTTTSPPPPPPSLEEEQQYGLILRPSKRGKPLTTTTPLLLQNKIPGEGVKDDITLRPDELDPSQYASTISVSAFGKAMLKGMGWEPGKAIGVSNKGLDEPIEFIPRFGRQGLGAAADPSKARIKKYIKPGESRNARAPLALPRGPDGKVRHYRKLSEQLVTLESLTQIEPGTHVRIIRGRHKDLDATVISISASQTAKLRLHTSDSLLSLPLSDLRNIKDPDLAPVTDSKKAKKGSKSGGSRKDRRPSKKSSFLAPNIRVRIISKSSFKGGKYYNKKGKVVDVPSHRVCSLLLDDSNTLLDSVRESYLETVVPRKPGSLVRVVAGPHAGINATLVSRDSRKSKAVVQLLDDTNPFVELSFDQIAQLDDHPQSSQSRR